ncbi:hypothetical protein EU803_15325 [Loktanella sp. IMCC34160]|nr:hypothetical protein EU803_15325 [Loktanella sp. IMCC34160]
MPDSEALALVSCNVPQDSLKLFPTYIRDFSIKPFGGAKMKLTALSAAILFGTVGAAFAKGHDQGNTVVPGADDVGTVTVFSAQSLGGALGERPDDKGPAADNPAQWNAGR